MPPEQAAGSSVDLPVDVYALGCVLFELLAGRPPFLAETNLELLGAHLRAPIPKLAEALPDHTVAPELQALIDRAMAKKQTERFPNARAMLIALEQIPQPALTSGAPSPASTQAQARAHANDERETEPGVTTKVARISRKRTILAPWLLAAAVVLAVTVFALLR
jgi:serine/threonine protein kinase